MSRKFSQEEVQAIVARNRLEVRASMLQERARQPRIGRRSETRPCTQLSMLLGIPGFAQEAKPIPPVATRSGAAGVTDEGQVVCTCGGGVTDLELGRLVDCVGGCGRFFAGTADKAFSFGPWADYAAAV
jgi:hypothetical protein